MLYDFILYTLLHKKYPLEKLFGEGLEYYIILFFVSHHINRILLNYNLKVYLLITKLSD